jgi:hypothetical protein
VRRLDRVEEMGVETKNWVIVAGLAEDRSKLYCDEHGRPGSASLERAMVRARSIAAWTDIVLVVLDEHRPWWTPIASALPEENVVVEPFDRGTAAGILVALLRIFRRDPAARVTIVAADRSSTIEDVVTLHARATAIADMRDACVGIAPAGRIAELSTLDDVEMVVGFVDQLLGLFRAKEPKLLHTYMTELRGPAAFSDDALFSVYPFLPDVPFSNLFSPADLEALPRLASA